MAETEEIKSAIRIMKDVKPDIEYSFEWWTAFTGKVPQAVWCEECQHDGYKSRVAVVEILELSNDIKQMIVENKSSMEVYGEMRQGWFITMKEDAYLKMLKWNTTLDEIRRVM